MITAISQPVTEVCILTEDLRFWKKFALKKNSGSQLAGFVFSNKNYLI